MKRLFIVLLVLVVMVPLSAFAEDRDSIVGKWYYVFDASSSPEFASIIEPYEVQMCIYFFCDDGIINALGLFIQDGKGTTEYSPAGKWEKKDSTYQYSILGLGEGTAIVEDDCLYLQIAELNGVSVRLRRLVEFSLYKDYVIK